MSDLALTAAGRLDATASPEQRLRQAARQFESVFLAEVMKPLDQAAEDGETGLFDEGPAAGQYRQLLHGAMAEQAAGGLGVADTLVRALALKPVAAAQEATP